MDTDVDPLDSIYCDTLKNVTYLQMNMIHFDALLTLFPLDYPSHLVEALNSILLSNANAGSLTGHSITATGKDEFLSTVFCNGDFITHQSLSGSAST